MMVARRHENRPWRYQQAETGSNQRKALECGSNTLLLKQNDQQHDRQKQLVHWPHMRRKSKTDPADKSQHIATGGSSAKPGTDGQHNEGE